MNTVLQGNCNCQFHQEIYALIAQLERKLTDIIYQKRASFNSQNQINKITGELEKIHELMAFYKLKFATNCINPNQEFIQGYQIGKQCNQVLYDASQIPVQEVKMALALDLSQNPVSPYLIGIQVGWRLAIIEQGLARFLPDEKTDIA